MTEKRANLSKEMQKLDEQFQNFDEQVKNLTLDEMNKAPKLETEKQTKLSSKEIDNSNRLVIKPNRTIGSKDKFNEEFRDAYNFKKELVNFIAENKEIIGESLEFWTRPFGGMPAEFWIIPVNTPVWAPRYVAEQIKSKRYHRLKMNEAPYSSDGGHAFYGSPVVESTVQRLDAYPVSNQRSVFMGVA